MQVPLIEHNLLPQIRDAHEAYLQGLMRVCLPSQHPPPTVSSAFLEIVAFHFGDLLMCDDDAPL